MEEIEVPTEHIQEEINHHAESAHDRWVLSVALSSAIIAALAAIAALLAGHHSNEAMIEQIQASNQWAYYQAKGVKGAVLGSKVDLLHEMGRNVKPSDEEKLGQYKDDQDAISEVAKEKEESSERHLQKHIPLSRAVTFFQIAIAISAISVLTRRRIYWLGSLLLGGCGVIFLIYGLLP